MSARTSLIRRLAWLPIPLLLLAMIGLRFADLHTVYDPPHLVQTLNLLFSLPVASFIAYQAGNSFLLRRMPGLLLFGCGILFWGSAGPVSSALLSYGPAVTVAIHNALIWLAVVCHLVGATLSVQRRLVVRWPGPWLAGAYTGVFTLTAVIALAAISDAMPVFFIQGQGGTPLRRGVLSSAIAMLILTAALLQSNRRRVVSDFQYWYALGLLLIAAGLFGVMIESSVGSTLSWVGRIAQYLGSVYLMAASVAALRETRDWFLPLEAALDEAKQQIEDLFDLAADGIVVHELISETARGHFLQVNPAVCALLGYTPLEMQNLTPLDLLTPEDLQKVPADVENMRRNATLRHEKNLKAKDGRLIPVEISSRTYRRQGRTMVLSVIRDVTERKQAEATVRASDQFKQAVLDAVPAHVAVLNREGVIITVNEPWRRFAVAADGTGKLSANTGVGVNYLEVCLAAAADGVEGALDVHSGIKAILEGKTNLFFHEYACHSLQIKRWFNLIVTPLPGSPGGVVVAHSDITLARQLTEELRAALEEKDTLLREVHHRVKNNLAAIIGLLELQREGATEATTASSLAELRNRVHSMALIHQMLYQSQSLSQINFQDYIQALIAHLRDALDPQGVTCIRVAGPELWMNLETAIPCGLIVNELVTNAFKYAFPQRLPRVGIGLCEITVTAGWDGTLYTLTVADNGVGLPAGLDWTTTRTLGLRLVRMLGQHQLRGGITFDGVQGTCCTLRFGPRQAQGSVDHAR